MCVVENFRPWCHGPARARLRQVDVRRSSRSLVYCSHAGVLAPRTSVARSRHGRGSSARRPATYSASAIGCGLPTQRQRPPGLHRHSDLIELRQPSSERSRASRWPSMNSGARRPRPASSRRRSSTPPSQADRPGVARRSCTTRHPPRRGALGTPWVRQYECSRRPLGSVPRQPTPASSHAVRRRRRRPRRLEADDGIDSTTQQHGSRNREAAMRSWLKRMDRAVQDAPERLRSGSRPRQRRRVRRPPSAGRVGRMAGATNTRIASEAVDRGR